MRKRLKVAIAAALVVAVAVGLGIFLKGEAERNWRLALERLEQGLGPGAEVRYGELDLDLFALGGRVRALTIEAPGLPEPFELAVEELRARGLAAEGEAGIRFDSGTAAGLTLDMPEGRWQVARVELEDFAFAGSPGVPLGQQLEALSLSSGTVENISFEQLAEPVDPLVGELARLELGRIAEAVVESLRFERLALDQGREQHLELERGGLDGLSLTQLAGLAEGAALPGRPLAAHSRLEGLLLRDDEAEFRFASLEATESLAAGDLRQELTVEGLTFQGTPLLGSFWPPIQQAGFEPAFRLHGVTTLTPEDGHLRLESLLLEVPEAASLELALEVLGLTEQPLPPDSETLEAEAAALRLVSASVTLVDSGGLDVVLTGPAAGQGMTAQQLRQVAAFQVVEAMRQGVLPREIGLALQAFLAEPGRLEIRLQPEQPAPLLSAALFAFAPQLAVEQFGVSAEAGSAK